MKTINLQVNGQPLIFTGQSVTYAGHEFYYSKMSNVAHRGGDRPAYLFDYEGKRIALPYDPKDKNVTMKIFQQVVALEKKRKEETQSPKEEPVAPGPDDTADFSMFNEPGPEAESQGTVPPKFSFTSPEPQPQRQPVMQQPTPPSQYTDRERQMVCPRCGSSNVIVHNTEKQHFKQGHGCLGFIFFGIYYICWLIIKWTCKIFAVGFYWVCVGWWYSIYCKAQGKNRTTPQFIKNLTRKRGKMYSDTITHGVCQACGHTWTI